MSNALQKNICSKLIILASQLFCGCSIVTYELREELPETTTIGACDITFALDLKSGYHTNSFGAELDQIKEFKMLRQSYINSTKNALSDLGCVSKQAKKLSEANFSIDVSRQLQLSALPQEWLTGLSLGLIPSWGTKYGQFVYTFTNSDKGQKYSYKIDQNNYSHISLFPVFWLTFFTADEQRSYKRALTNFIYSSQQNRDIEPQSRR